MTLTDFRIRYPEFRTASDAFVNAYLVDAVNLVRGLVLLPVYDTAHGLATAHLIAISPAGKNARMVNDDGTTQYGKTLHEIMLSYVAGVSIT